MLHARPDYNRIQDPAELIPAEEPVFLLRAQDRTAPATLDYWIALQIQFGGDPALIQLTRNHAAAMRAWQEAHPPKLADLVRKEPDNA